MWQLVYWLIILDRTQSVLPEEERHRGRIYVVLLLYTESKVCQSW